MRACVRERETEEGGEEVFLDILLMAGGLPSPGSRHSRVGQVGHSGTQNIFRSGGDL